MALTGEVETGTGAVIFVEIIALLHYVIGCLVKPAIICRLFVDVGID